MSANKTCTIYTYNSNGDCIGMCDAPARAVYTRPNPEAGPRQPTVLTYHRCRTHDSAAIQKAAAEQDFTRETID